MAAPTPANPSLSPINYDPVNHQQNVAYRVDNVTTDTSVTPNVSYGDLGIQVDVSVSAPTDATISGTISAAQSAINTPVSNATVVLALGAGQSAWKAQLKDGGGGFTSGTTLVADKSIDGGATYFTTSFKVTSASPSTPQSTVVGPGPLELTGNAAGATHVRLRCSVLNSTETIAVRINASVGTADVGLLSSIPAGTNTIGSVNIANANANGQATMANSSPVVLPSDQIVSIALLGGSANEQWYTVDNVGDNAHHGIGAVAQSAFNGSPNYTYDKLRIANVFKTATATASGNTAVWTPTSGTRFRLMRFRLDLPTNAAISGGGVIVDITFQDATTALGIGISVFVPTTAVTTTMGAFTTGWIDLGNGIFSAAANNVLNINLSATLTTGKVRVSVAGMEE